MKIISFLYEENKPMHELYVHVGKWLTSRKLIQKLGMPILADNGNIWLIGLDENNNSNGFAIIRLNKNNSAHIRFLYSEDESVSNLLLGTILEMLKDKEINTVSTNDLKTNQFWFDNGFTSFERVRGKFCRWSKILKEK